MANGSLLVKYNDELFKGIQEIFITYIVPENFILVIHKYNSNVLTHRDIEELQKTTRYRATKEVNFELLSKMKSYNGWFEVILQVCKDPDVKQGFFVEVFEKVKRELDEKWTSDQTKRKEIDTGLANVTLKSKSNQGTVTMGRQLSSDGVLETDSAVCISPESRQGEDKNSKELATEDNSGSTHQPFWEGLKLKNGKHYCDICRTSLTSEKAAEDHFKGKPHQKKLKEVKEAVPVSQELSTTDISMAAIAQATYVNVKSTPPCFQPNPVSDKTVVSSGPTFDYKVIPESPKPMFCSDGSNTKELLTEGQRVTANTSCWGGLKMMENGNQYCDLCETVLTSQAVADAHCKGKQHEKKLNKAFPTGQSASETSSTPVSEFQAGSSSIGAVHTSLGLSDCCETAVSSAPVSVSKGTTANFKTTSFNDKKISTSLSNIDTTPAGSSAMKASATSLSNIETTSAGSSAMKASAISLSNIETTPAGSSAMKASATSLSNIETTPAGSSAMKASATSSVVTPDSSCTSAAGLKQTSVRDEDYIVNNNGLLECKLCRTPVTSGVSAAQHLQGGKHKKKLEALRVQVGCHEDPPELGPHGEVIILAEDGSGKCYVCNAPINSRESAKQHMEGKKHINQCKRYGIPADVHI